jgi:hypothetical protein
MHCLFRPLCEAFDTACGFKNQCIEVFLTQPNYYGKDRISGNWSTENPDILHEVPLHDLKGGISCAVSAWGYLGEPPLPCQKQIADIVWEWLCHPSLTSWPIKNRMDVLCEVMQGYALEQLRGCIMQMKSSANVSRIVASAITWFKPLWHVCVADWNEGSMRTIRTLWEIFKKLGDMIFLLFSYCSLDLCLETYFHDVRHA